MTVPLVPIRTAVMCSCESPAVSSVRTSVISKELIGTSRRLSGVRSLDRAGLASFVRVEATGRGLALLLMALTELPPKEAIKI